MSIVTNGLAFYLDPSNTKKSYKGAPTTNFALYSEQFTNAIWLFDASFPPSGRTENATTGPDGQMSGDLFYMTTASMGLFYQPFLVSTIGTGQQISSVYAKAGTCSTIIFNSYYIGDTEVNVTFTLLGNGTTDTPASSSITAVGNGWYRCVISTPARINAGTTFLWRVWLYGRSAPTNTNTSVYFWGAQLESGSYVTPYISTISAASVRSTTQAFLDITGNTTLTSNVTFASDGSFSFNGTSSAIYSLTPVNLPLGSSNRTMICWCKPDTTQVNADAYTGLIAYGARTASGGALLSINTSGSTFYATSAYWNNDYTPSTVVVNKAAWNMVAVTTLGDGVVNNTTLYCGNSSGINSVTGSSSSYATPLNLASSLLTIGSTDYFGRWFKGSIGAAMIYNRQLSLAELNQIFYATKARYGL